MYVEPSLPVRIVSSIAAKLSRPSRPVREMRPVAVEDEHPVILALRKAGKPLTNKQLAQAMGCSEGQASKLRRKVRDRIIEVRRGGKVFVMLEDFQSFPDVSNRKVKRNGRKS